LAAAAFVLAAGATTPSPARPAAVLEVLAMVAERGQTMTTFPPRRFSTTTRTRSRVAGPEERSELSPSPSADSGAATLENNRERSCGIRSPASSAPHDDESFPRSRGITYPRTE
jgi:hypothetical protein